MSQIIKFTKRKQECIYLKKTIILSVKEYLSEQFLILLILYFFYYVGTIYHCF